MTKTVATLFMAAIATAIALLSLAAVPAAAVEQFGTAEIVLLASRSYDGRAGEPNPFDLEVTARVTSPSGKLAAVPGFFDGDGEGGAVGRVFKVRVAADETGTWRWTASGDVPGVAGREGSFEVAGRLSGFFGRGPLGVSPERPRSFRQREETSSCWASSWTRRRPIPSASPTRCSPSASATAIGRPSSPATSA